MLVTEDSFNAFKTFLEGAIKADFDPAMFNLPSDTDKPYTVVNGVAILDFQGITVSDCSDLEALILGTFSLQGFCEDLQMAVDDETVSDIIVNFNSGGGFTQYGDETCELVKSLTSEKPIYAYCGGGYMCSMAYKVASNMSSIVVSPSAYIGSIGGYLQLSTLIGANQLSPDGVTESTIANFGVKVTTFQSGKNKTQGNEAIELTQEQKQQILKRVNDSVNQFRQMVIANRGDIKQEFMEGDAYTGKEAMDLDTNLVDGLCNSLNEFVQFILNNNN